MVVDDEERIRSLLARSLTAEGHSVVAAASGASALSMLDEHRIDLVLLDLVMPGQSGFTVLSALRERGSMTPVIVISGVTDVGARVQALDRGAVDVVGKPFTLAELMARVRRNLTTRRPEPDDRYLAAGGVRLDRERHRARFDGRDVALTEREFTLLAHLIRRRGEVCRREELLHDVWALDFDPGSNVVEVCVRRVRAKLGTTVPIETVRGVGYCFYEE